MKKNSKLKNLVVRAISGAVFISIMIAAIWLPPYLFGAVFLLIAILGLREFYSLSDHMEEVRIKKIFTIISGCLLYLSVYLYTFGFLPVQVFSLYILCVIAIYITELFKKEKNPIQNIAVSLLGHIYIVLPLCFISMIESSHKMFVLAFFIMIWMSDTGAYLVGITIGRHKMFERISPKKTWEGFFGGMLFALITAYVFYKVTPSGAEKLLELWQWFAFALVVFVFGTLGDLTESLFKRSLNVKDSGSLIPGHGGILDRFDSAIMAAPAVFVFLSIYFNN